MARRGRSWTRRLAAAVAVCAAGTAIAAPPFPPLVGPQTFAGQHAVAPVADRAGPASLGETTPFKPPAITPGPSRVKTRPGGAAPGASIADVTTGPAQDIPSDIPASAAEGRPQAGKGWIAAVGAFRRPGTYELSGDFISAAEFVESCGGAEHATGLRLVRNGRPLGLLYRPADRLIAGDVLIAESGGSPQSSVTVAAFEDRRATPRADAEIAIVGLTGRPVAVKIPGAYATVPGVLQCAGQTHLSPGDVTVLTGGIEEVPGDRIDVLTSGSVVVFAPEKVDPRAVAANPPQTREYRADSASPPSVLPESLSGPAMPMPGAESRLVSAGLADVAPVQTADAGLSDMGLSSVPPVEMLAPPADEPKLRYPRTADASGAVPIGAPEADTHIVPLPSDAFPSAVSESPSGTIRSAPESAAPMSPAQAIAAVEPIDLSAMDESDAESELPLGDLLPTIVVGGLLGAFTFLCIRWLRSLPLIARLMDRLLGRTVATAAPIEPEPLSIAEPAPVAPPSPPAPAAPRRKAMAPDDLLGALIADRLAFREEDVAIPAALRVHGRSSALRKRRIDPPAAVVPDPHLPGVTARTPEAVLAEKVRRHKAAEAAERSTMRIDPPRPASPPAPAASRTIGTPFERALAILNEAGQRNRL